jgi:hypothetical protein
MDNRVTKLFVGMIMMAILFYVFLAAAGWKIGTAFCVVLLFEGWTLINNRRQDTISEVIWEFARRPMIPWLFGVATGYLIATGFFSDPVLGVGWGFLCGHFFFQKHEEVNG